MGLTGGVTADWRKLQNEELCDLYCSPAIIRVIKSGEMRWAGHVALFLGEEKCMQSFSGET